MQNRIYKFRSWNNAENTMGDPFTLQTAIGSRLHQGVDTAGVIYQQFTGLHDKNGKEIYEGDIVYHDDSHWQVIYTANSEGVTRAAFMLDRRGDITTHSVKGMPMLDIEVVGNIYENPELLLKESK